MRIKLAILEKDANYLKRIVSVFNTKYSDKLEIYSFTDYEVALGELQNSKIDIFIVSDTFEVDVKRLPKRCGFAYFVDSHNVETIREQMAICKFQKADLIYKQILSLYSENASDISGLKLTDDVCKLIAFTSLGGGAGSSTMAAACAICFAKRGKKVLHLNLDSFGSSDMFFNAEGQFDMSDVIYALKSKKTNIALKIESCIKQDASGVNFFSQTKIALDMMELNTDDILRLISELTVLGIYDYIVIDMDFGIGRNYLDIFSRIHSIVVTGDGTDISNCKIQRAFQSMILLDKSMDISLLNRMYLLYNKFSSKTGKMIDSNHIKILGGAPIYKQGTAIQIAEQISGMNVFDELA